MTEFEAAKEYGKRGLTRTVDVRQELAAAFAHGAQWERKRAAQEAPSVIDARLLWTENAPPDESCPYHHTSAATPFGRFLITWKGWKEYPVACLEEAPWPDHTFHTGDVEKVKRMAEADYAERLRLAAQSHPADKWHKFMGAYTTESGAASDVLAERKRQVEVEGWTPAHDDEHGDGSLAEAAACYARGSCEHWPWDGAWWKPNDRRSNLVRAGALILAELERIDRFRAPEAPAGDRR